MTDYRGTPSNDVIDNRALNLGPGDNIFGEAGDDHLISVTLTNLVGGPGNDKLEGGGLAMAVYWNAASPVTLDLDAGYADDGLGGRDVLIGIKGAHGSDQDDRFLGDGNNNIFWPNGGVNYVDGRGGEDIVILTSDPIQTIFSRNVSGHWTYSSQNGNGELHNVELLQYYYGGRFSPIYSIAGVNAEIYAPKIVRAGDPQAIGSSYQEISTEFFRVSQFNFGSYSINEAHAEFYYPKITDTHAAGSFSLDPHNMVTGDFNGDGLEDLAVIWVAFPHTVFREAPVYPQIFLNRGDGTLGPANEIISGPLPNRHMNYRTHAADFNGDGRDDLVIASMAQGAQKNPVANADLREPITLLLSTPSGKMVDASRNIQGQEQGGVPEGYSFGHDMSVGDLDGDGDIDFYTNKVLMLNDGKGFFTLASGRMPEEARSFSYVMSSGMGDLDGDGIDDLVVAYAEGYGRYAFLSNGKGVEGARVIRLPEGPYGLENTKSNYLSIGDLTGDGYPDILIACTRGDPYYQGQYLQLFVNKGNGIFVEDLDRVNNAPFDTYHGEGQLYLRDMNGDGSVDIVHATGKTWTDAGFLAGGIHVFLNDGGGYFSAVDPNVYAYVNSNQLEGWGSTGQSAKNVPPRMVPIQLGPGPGVDLIGSVMTPNWSDTLPNISQVTLFVSEAIRPLGRGVDERLVGSANDDVFWGLDGNDRIEGGLGVDTVVFVDRLADVSIKVLDKLAIVSTKTEGVDTLVNVDRLRFADQMVNMASLPIDTSAPTVTTLSPADDSTNVAASNNIVVTFNEAIALGTGTVEIRSGSPTGTIIESFNAAASGRLAVSGSTLTIDPTNDLAAGIRYFVVIPSGAVRDTAGNAYAGTSAYDFTVSAAPNFSTPSQSVSTNEDTAKAITLAATDADSDPLTYTATAAGNGSVVVSGSTATYTPNANYNGADSFVVTASDGKGGTAIQTISIMVSAVNDAPVFGANSQSALVAIGSAKTISLSAADVDGDALIYTVTAPSKGAASISGNTLIYTASSIASGSDSFTVTASDGKGGTATQKFTIYQASKELDGPSEIPVAGQSVGFSGNQYLTFFSGGNEFGVFYNYNGDKIERNIPIDEFGLPEKLQDGTVVIVSQVLRTLLSGEIVKSLVANFIGSDGQSIKSEKVLLDFLNPEAGGLRLAAMPNGNFAFLWQTFPVGGPAGRNQVLLQIFDSAGSPVSAIKRIENAGLNAGMSSLSDGRLVIVWDATIATSNTSNTLQDVYGRIFNQFGDSVNEIFSINTTTAGMQFVPRIVSLTGGGFVVAWRDASVSNDVSTTARIFDTNGKPIGGEFILHAPLPGNQIGVSLTALNSGGFVAAWTDYSQTGDDTSGVAVRARFFSATGEPEAPEFLVNASTAGNQVFPNIKSVGNNLLVVNWTEFPMNSSGEDLVGKSRIIYLDAVNLPPKFAADSQAASATAGAAKTIALAATDVDGDTLTYTVATPGKGTATISGGTLTYTPASSASGADSFVVTASDGKGGTATQTISATIAPPADTTPPTVTTFAPADGATNVTAGSNVVLTFNEAIALGSGTIEIRSGSAAGPLVESFNAATSTRLSVSGSTLTIDPTSNLAAGTKYYVVLPSGAIRDTAGNAYAGTSTYDFTTATPAAASFRLITSDGWSGAVGGTGTVFGTAGYQDVTLLSGSLVFDASFNRGGDVLRYTGPASSYAIARSGSSAQISAGTGLSVSVPVGVNGLLNSFDDGVRKLAFASGSFRIGEQAFANTATPIVSAPGSDAIPSGADANARASAILSAGSLAAGQTAGLTIGGRVSIFGSSEADIVAIAPNQKANIVFDASFNRGGDVVILPNQADAYTATRVGSSVLLVGADQSLTIPVGTRGLTLRFADVDRDLLFASGAVKIGDQSIGTVATPLTPSATLTSIDIGTSSVSETVSGAAGKVIFTDDPTKNSFVKIRDFGSDDRIQLKNGTGYDFTTGDFDNDGLADDLAISFSIPETGIINEIHILNAVSPDAFVADQATAIAAVGFNFMTFA